MKARGKKLVRTDSLAARAANEFQFFSFEEMSEITGLGRDVWTRIAAFSNNPEEKDPPPIIARKINPRLMLDWLARNAHRVGKIRD